MGFRKHIVIFSVMFMLLGVGLVGTVLLTDPAELASESETLDDTEAKVFLTLGLLWGFILFAAGFFTYKKTKKIQ